MNRVEVKILEHNLDGTSKFLARLTQRGDKITSMADVISLYEESIKTPPSETLLTLPHTTIRRMNYLTIAIVGLSTKAVSQLRTHAKRLTFVSTSTQYSSYENRPDNYVIPDGLTDEQKNKMRLGYSLINDVYAELIRSGVDKDAAGYLLPQGLRKALIISGPLDAWEYVISLRLCHRNTLEVQHIMRLILDEIRTTCGKEYIVNMLPSCVKDKCNEGKFSCGERFKLEDENTVHKVYCKCKDSGTKVLFRHGS